MSDLLQNKIVIKFIKMLLVIFLKVKEQIRLFKNAVVALKSILSWSIFVIIGLYCET